MRKNESARSSDDEEGVDEVYWRCRGSRRGLRDVAMLSGMKKRGEVLDLTIDPCIALIPC